MGVCDCGAVTAPLLLGSDPVDSRWHEQTEWKFQLPVTKNETSVRGRHSSLIHINSPLCCKKERKKPQVRSQTIWFPLLYFFPFTVTSLKIHVLLLKHKLFPSWRVLQSMSPRWIIRDTGRLYLFHPLSGNVFVIVLCHIFNATNSKLASLHACAALGWAQSLKGSSACLLPLQLHPPSLFSRLLSLNFPRGKGPLKNSSDVINAAKKIAEAGSRMDKLARAVADQVALQLSLCLLSLIFCHYTRTLYQTKCVSDCVTVSGGGANCE